MIARSDLSGNPMRRETLIAPVRRPLDLTRRDRQDLLATLRFEHAMDPDLRIKLAAYHHFAETARRPTPDEVATRANSTVPEVLAAYQRLRAQRVLLLEADGASIRMAPPFSGVPTQHTAV